jgi:hypothetical protein
VEIEEVRYANEDLFEAAVVGVLHEIHGEVPIASWSGPRPRDRPGPASDVLSDPIGPLQVHVLARC